MPLCEDFDTGDILLNAVLTFAQMIRYKEQGKRAASIYHWKTHTFAYCNMFVV